MSVREVNRDLAFLGVPKRKHDTHKGDYGRALVISGSRRYVGAPFFAAQAAVNTGAGLVFIAHPKDIYPALTQKLNEPVFLPLPCDDAGVLSKSSICGIATELENADACLAGPGLGRGSGIDSVIAYLLESFQNTLVLDADALYSLSLMLDKLKKTRAKTILTPHEGEFKRLFPGFDKNNRLRAAREFSTEYNCVLVLKGHRTITSLPSGDAYINTSGNPGMAKGGSGDVLAGIITALAAEGIEPETAAYTGVWMHGAAGDYCRDLFGEYGMTPTDMLNGIKIILKGRD